MRIIEITTLVLSLLVSCKSLAQDIIKDGVFERIDGRVNPQCSIMNYLECQSRQYDLTDVHCGLPHGEENNKIFVIRQQADLMYYELFFDSLQVHIREQGYYRFYYYDGETGYCWAKDLIWNRFDPSGRLIEKVFYNKGKIQDAPFMGEPIYDKK